MLAAVCAFSCSIILCLLYHSNLHQSQIYTGVGVSLQNELYIMFGIWPRGRCVVSFYQPQASPGEGQWQDAGAGACVRIDAM